MEKVLAFVLMWICGSVMCVEGPTFNFTYEMEGRCKRHLCHHGYVYELYYDVFKELTQKPTGKGLSLEMHIAIQASSNGHILLSPVPFPDHNDAVYEIVVGGGGNKFTELRRNLKRNAKASLRTENILSAIELRGFYIKIDDGLIEFGKEGSTLPLISFNDLYPLDIKYFSFAAWNGVEAKFLYDCPNWSTVGSNVTVAQDSKKIERNLSASDRLKRDKLQDRLPYLPPRPVVPVTVQARLSSVSFNAFEAKLTTRMSLKSLWKDESLMWNPDKFNGLTNVTYRQGQIWKPTFHVYNSDNLNALKTTGNEIITIQSDGEASFYFKATVQTWCFSESSTYNKWPRDEYSCSIVIQPWEAHEKIILAVLKDPEATDDILENNWELINVRQFVVPADKWNRMYPLQTNTTHQSDRFVISLALQRRPANYNIAFYTPLLILMLFVLMSFWGEPLKMSRVWFYAGASVFVSAGLCFIDYLIPCHTIPTILVLYITVLYSVLAALILHVMMMTSVAERLCKSTAMQNVLSTSWFRMLFCLPAIKVCRSYNRVNDGYSQQEDDESPSSAFAPNGTVEEMRSEANKYCEREELGEVLDKLMFLVYSVLFAAMLAAHY